MGSTVALSAALVSVTALAAPVVAAGATGGGPSLKTSWFAPVAAVTSSGVFGVSLPSASTVNCDTLSDVVCMAPWFVTYAERPSLESTIAPGLIPPVGTVAGDFGVSVPSGARVYCEIELPVGPLVAFAA